MSPDAYLDTTENDKQRFFAAMEAAGVKPTFENHSDDEEDEVDVSFHLTEFSSAPDLNPDKEDKDVVEKDNSSAPLYSESSFESFSEKKQTHQTEEAIKREEVATSEALTSMSEESSLKLLVETEAAATEDRTTELIARAKEGAVDQTIESTNVGSLLEDYEESQVEIHQAGLSMGETSDLGAITDKILKEIEVESEFSVIKTAPVTLIHDESQSLAEEPTLDHPIPQEAPSILQDDTTTDHVSAASKTEENDVSSFGLDSAVGESVLHHHQSRIEEPSHDLDISFRSNRSLVQRSPPIKDVKTVVEDDTTSSSSVKIKSASIPESPSRSVSSAFTELSFARPKTPTKKSTIVSPSPKKATRKIGPSPRKSKDALKSPDKKQLAFDNAIKLLADTEKAIGKIVDVTDTVPKAATAAEGSIPSGFILMDVKELTELKDTIAELMECQQDLQNGFEHRGKENDTLKEEIRLLESILEKEQENSRKLMAKAGTTFPADAEKLKKDIDEQELLLHGYQLENEKLIMENKDLKKGLREAEKLALLKTEKLTREVSTLRLQVQERERTQTRTDFGAAQYQLKIEALEAQLESTRSNLMDREAELNLEIEKWKAQFEQALKAPMSPGKAAAITEMPLSEKAKEKYEARIVELEGKLQLLHDKEELLEDYTRRIVDKDAEMKDLRTALDIANSKLEVKEVKISDRKNVNSKRLNETSVAASDEVALLKDQIRSLEIAKDTVIKESETQIRTLQEDVRVFLCVLPCKIC